MRRWHLIHAFHSNYSNGKELQHLLPNDWYASITKAIELNITFSCLLLLFQSLESATSLDGK